ncbi:hypothetical protein JAAARDRAFT_205412 [Jaapia argillacea MUCL 33604]|uniref:Bet v I/Major latex protein domain-containing protein n=1 Tax=Jaapia argillacea MUCL 33604 TaxID=933084 RepID=A0A067QD15_9AGAM|nr:hypothetical protein JAAARDRAFT_205412 [Jaapia argillacea MUCL 33604]
MDKRHPSIHTLQPLQFTMVNYAAAATRPLPVNIPKAQVWSILKAVARNPIGFGGITESTIVSENEDGTEFYTAKWPDTGSAVNTILSSDSAGINYASLTFLWVHPEIQPGTEEDKKMVVQYDVVAQKAMENLLKAIEERAKE